MTAAATDRAAIDADLVYIIRHPDFQRIWGGGIPFGVDIGTSDGLISIAGPLDVIVPVVAAFLRGCEVPK